MNPAHLEPVTHAENIRRGRHPNKEKTECPQGHPYDDANTYKAPSGARNCRTCNREAVARLYERKRKVAS